LEFDSGSGQFFFTIITDISDVLVFHIIILVILS
jgi:hypothetical protein